MSRRGFLRVAAAAAGTAALVAAKPWAEAASAASGAMCESTVPDAKIGIQLFTCTGFNALNRDAMMERIAGLGYAVVEHAGYGSDAKAYRASLDAVGLRAISGHTGLPRPFKADTWRKLVEDAQIIGQRYIVWPSASGSSAADWIEIAEIMNRAGLLAFKAGMGRHAVGYHNHGAEYQPIAGDKQGRRPIDILMKYCDPSYTHQQMDIGWAWSTSDPITELHRFPGRYRQFHVKDMVGVPQNRRSQLGASGAGPVVPGAGMVDFVGVFTAAKESRQPIASFLVENDTSVATCLDAAAAGYELLHGMKYPHRCR